MAYLCEFVEESSKVCLKWVEYNSVLDQIAITKAQAFMIITPIFSIYALLIGWSFIMILYHQNK